MGLKLTVSKNQLQTPKFLDFCSSSISQATSTGAFVNGTCFQETCGIQKVSTLASKPMYFISLSIHSCFQTATNKKVHCKLLKNCQQSIPP